MQMSTFDSRSRRNKNELMKISVWHIGGGGEGRGGDKHSHKKLQVRPETAHGDFNYCLIHIILFFQNSDIFFSRYLYKYCLFLP